MRTSSLGVTLDESAVNPTISANRMLQNTAKYLPYKLIIKYDLIEKSIVPQAIFIDTKGSKQHLLFFSSTLQTLFEIHECCFMSRKSCPDSLSCEQTLGLRHVKNINLGSNNSHRMHQMLPAVQEAPC